MKVVLNIGEKLIIEIAENDGEFVVEFGEDELTVSADISDAQRRTNAGFQQKICELHDHPLDNNNNCYYCIDYMNKR